VKSILWSAVVVAALAPAAWSQDSTIVKDTLPTHIKSPFRDYNEKMSLSLFTGYFGGNRGQAGVGPQGKFLVGAQYLMHLGGPASAIARLTYVPTSRYVVDPYQPKATQVSGPISEPLYMLDVGITADITGEKLWHGTAPYAGFAIGLANGGNQADVGGYKFGTQFYLSLGGGVKWQVGDRWVMTANAWFYFWQLHYPTTYFTSGPNTVLSATAPDKDWTTNGVYTIGFSYLLRK
jgi:hypothetical protein